MKRTQIVWFTCLAALVAFVLAASHPSSSAAQKAEDSAGKTKSQAGRLPNYYVQVTSEEQHPKLREVAKQFGPKIQQKREELQALLAERNAALDEILTADQKAEVAKLRAAAAARRGTSNASANDGKSKSKKAKTTKKAA